MPFLFLKTYWKPLLVASSLIAAAYLGYSYSNEKWESKMLAIELENQRLQTLSEKVTIQEVIKYVDRVKIVKERGEEIIRKVPYYVNVEADNNCVINDGFVWLHNKAIDQSISEPTGDLNANTTGVELSTVSETVASNYQKYHEVVEQLKALQSWIVEQQAIHNK